HSDNRGQARRATHHISHAEPRRRLADCDRTAPGQQRVAIGEGSIPMGWDRRNNRFEYLHTDLAILVLHYPRARGAARRPQLRAYQGQLHDHDAAVALICNISCIIRTLVLYYRW